MRSLCVTSVHGSGAPAARQPRRPAVCGTAAGPSPGGGRLQLLQGLQGCFEILVVRAAVPREPQHLAGRFEAPIVQAGDAEQLEDCHVLGVSDRCVVEKSNGGTGVSLGERVLRVEPVIPLLVGRLLE